jgi:hypothetical protein
VIHLRVVNRIILAFAHIRRKRLGAIRLALGVIRLAIVLDEISKKRIGTDSVIRRIGKRQNLRLGGSGKSFALAEFGSCNFSRTSLKITPASFVIFKSLAEVFDRLVALLVSSK